MVEGQRMANEILGDTFRMRPSTGGACDLRIPAVRKVLGLAAGDMGVDEHHFLSKVMERATVFDHLRPDAVVTIGDRHETMATAVAAAYLNIPLVHIQGGEITGSIDEKVRHAVTKLADVHMVSTERAAERVIRMGERADRVFNTGCPSIDVARRALEQPEIDHEALFEGYGGVGERPDLSQGYIVVLQHPVTTEYDE